MPNYKGHLVGGFCAFVVGAYGMRSFLNPSYGMLGYWFVITSFGALFPDIDTKSKGQKIFYRIIALSVTVLLMQHRIHDVAFISIVALSPLLVKHRGITHSLLFIMVLSLVIVMYAFLYYPAHCIFVAHTMIFFFLGAFSHIVLDFGPRKFFLYSR